MTQWGPNVIVRRVRRRWPAQLAAQLIHPLALLLAAAAVLSWSTGTPALAGAIVAVILTNAGFAFLQERHAEHAVEALAAFLPERVVVVRDGHRAELDAATLVVGDVIELTAGERVCADARLIAGVVEIDMSTLTGEAAPVRRSATGVPDPVGSSPLTGVHRVFSGTTCTGGQALALVTATGMRTELGRISALSERTRRDSSPLEKQVRRLAWLIAAVAVAVGAAFLPAGIAAGMGWAAAATFAIGLIVANVPEGLLPTITLALALGVRDLARHNAVVKQLSAVETLGSATVICTDKTGTLTLNAMRVTQVWTVDGDVTVADLPPESVPETVRTLARAGALCTTAELPQDRAHPGVGDPTELALLLLARDVGEAVDASTRDSRRVAAFPFDTELTRMSTVDRTDDGRLAIHTKGAPESVLPCCTHVRTGTGAEPLDPGTRDEVRATVDRFTARGLRVLAVAQRPVGSMSPDTHRDTVEAGLVLLGLVAMVDPPRPGVAAAIAEAHRAGLRIHVVTGDNGRTAAEIARQVGIGTAGGPVLSGDELDALSERDLDRLLAGPDEVVFARSSPEDKLRIADALRARGAVVAMTGDGVNDAPALRRSDIGVAMGRSGTDVAREAASMVLTDDDFATIVTAVRAGRQIYDNVRKFIVYIFAHAVPEVLPFVVYALSGGRVPLALSVMQILAIDLGTELLPSLALARERPEPGLMDRPPRSRNEGVITASMLGRAWGLLGLLSAVLVMGAYLVVLTRAGWHPGAPVGPGSPLHHQYRQAMTVAWLGIVAGQVGVAFASRTNRASLRSIGFLSNVPLLAAVGGSLLFAAAVVYLAPLQAVFGTTTPSVGQVLLVSPFPVIVWGADELHRARVRRRSAVGGRS